MLHAPCTRRGQSPKLPRVNSPQKLVPTFLIDPWDKSSVFDWRDPIFVTRRGGRLVLLSTLPCTHRVLLNWQSPIQTPVPAMLGGTVLISEGPGAILASNPLDAGYRHNDFCTVHPLWYPDPLMPPTQPLPHNTPHQTTVNENSLQVTLRISGKTAGSHHKLCHPAFLEPCMAHLPDYLMQYILYTM